jgi:LacI family transcriptional regulator
MAVRMKDIAHDLGVSLMTVSKALRNKSDVAEETRRRVLERARELKYQPNLIARSLVNRRTYLVGLIVPDMMHSFFAEVAKGVSDKLEPHGYQIVVCNSGERLETEIQQLKLLLSRHVDGVIIASAATSASGLPAEALSAPNTRRVLIDRSIPGVTGSFVGVDDEEIASLAVEHLVEQGCRRIAHIRGPEISTSIGRLLGYRRTLARRRLKAPPEYVIGKEPGDTGGYEAMRRLLRHHPAPDGVFAFNDPVAAGAIKAILEAGLRVPEDVAVVGAGNVHYSDLLRVPLTTVDQSSLLIGRTAAELLLDSIEAKEPPAPRRVVFSPRLIVRESSLRKK